MSRRQDFKAQKFSGKEKRRRDLLDRQKAARRDLTAHARQLVNQCVSSAENVVSEQVETDCMDQQVLILFLDYKSGHFVQTS